MSYVHALDGLRTTTEMFVRYDAQRFREALGDHRKARTGLLGLLEDDSQYVSIVADHLSRAEAVYWSPEMCDMLAHLTTDLPDWTLRMSDLIAPYGFAWFAKPLDLGVYQPVEGGEAERLPVAGMLWGDVRYRYDPSLGQRSEIAYVEDQDEDDLWVVFCPIMLFEGCPRVGGGSSWRAGEALSGLIRKDAAGEYDQFGAWATGVGRAFATAMALMEQRIITADRVILDRASRKRLARDGWASEPVVRVVKLRRARQDGKQPERDGEKAYELTCQFVVRGHWRQQYYPSTDEHRPIFILPYVKGPEDAPLKASVDRVFEMVR